MKPFSLPAGWEIKLFGQCIQKVKYTEKQPTKFFLPEGQFPIVSQEKELISGYSNNRNSVFSVKNPVVIFGDHTKVVKYIDFDFVIGADGVKILQPIEEINAKYFYYYLIHLHLRDLGYARHYKLLKECVVFYPPLSEQKRIVEKLDKIFAAIDKAKSQTEKNLQNAKALFNIYLNSLSYSTKKLGELVRITTGKLNANAQEKNGKYPFFTCSREILYINTYAFDCEAILLAGNNASADFNVKYYKGKFNAYQRTYVITIQDTYKLSYKYLYFQLIKELSQLKKIAVGANTRFLRLGMIKDINLALPPLEKQQQIVSCLDSLYAKTQELEKIYIQKLADLEELKQSVLQQAFSGKL